MVQHLPAVLRATDDTALVLDFTNSNLSASNTFALMDMDSDILNGNSVDLNIGGLTLVS